MGPMNVECIVSTAARKWNCLPSGSSTFWPKDHLSDPQATSSQAVSDHISERARQTSTSASRTHNPDIMT